MQRFQNLCWKSNWIRARIEFAREQRSETLLLLLLLLLLFLLLLLLLMMLLLLLLLLLLPLQFFPSLVVAENRQIGGVFAFCWDFLSKKHRKCRCFLRVGSPSHGIYDVVLLLVEQQPRYLQCFWTAPSKKHWYLRSFRHVTRSDFYMRKSQNLCNLQCFGSDWFVTGWRVGGGYLKWTATSWIILNNQVTGLANLPFTS